MFMIQLCISPHKWVKSTEKFDTIVEPNDKQEHKQKSRSYIIVLFEGY